MESISFRAWDKDERAMLDVHGINFDAQGIWTNELIDDESDGNFIFLDDVVLMQSTGLKDKNGTEIYEGDIVEVLVQDIEPKIMKDKMYIGVVVYKQGTFDIKISENTYLGIIPTMYMSDIDCTFEILGNAYENPELLEDE